MKLNTSNNKLIHETTSLIMGLVKSLEMLPAHPDKPQYKGALFTKIDPSTKPSDKNESMLGSMIAEGMITSAFSMAVSDVANDAPATSACFDLSTLADAMSEYIEDKSPERGEGKGSFATTKHRIIANDFNQSAMQKIASIAKANAMEIYVAALPMRMKIEHDIAFHTRRLHNLQAITPTLEFAA